MINELSICINNYKKVNTFVLTLIIIYVFLQLFLFPIIIKIFDIKNIFIDNEFISNYFSHNFDFSYYSFLIFIYIAVMYYFFRNQKEIQISIYKLKLYSIFLIVLFIAKKIYEIIINQSVISEIIIINEYFFFITINYILTTFTFCIGLLYISTRQLKYLCILLVLILISLFSLSKYYSTLLLFSILIPVLFYKFKIKYIIFFLFSLIFIIYPLQKNIKNFFQLTKYDTKLSTVQNLNSRFIQNNIRLAASYDDLNLKRNNLTIYINEVLHILLRINQSHIINLIEINKLSYDTLFIDGNKLGIDLSLIELTDVLTGIDPTFSGSLLIYLNSFGDDLFLIILILLVPIIIFKINNIFIFNSSIGIIFIPIIFLQYIYLSNSSIYSFYLTSLKFYLLFIFIFTIDKILLCLKQQKLIN